MEAVLSQIRDFFNARGHLSISSGLLTYDDCIVIPVDTREEILERIHAGHQGVTKCRELVRVVARNFKGDLGKCGVMLVLSAPPTNSEEKEPLMTTVLPDRPLQKVSTDLFELNGWKYLVVIDYYSGFIEILSLAETKSQAVIQKLKSVFARWGIPDNGTQFKSAMFDEYKAEYGFKHSISSPHHPQANGSAESGVRISKRILEQEDPFLALMTYRATPVPARRP